MQKKVDWFKIETKAWEDHQAGVDIETKPYPDDDSNEAYRTLRLSYEKKR